MYSYRDSLLDCHLSRAYPQETYLLVNSKVVVAGLIRDARLGSVYIHQTVPTCRQTTMCCMGKCPYVTCRTNWDYQVVHAVV